MKLILEAIGKVILGMVLVGLLIFLPAGTLSYANGWILMGILFVPMVIAGFVMLFRAPEFLKKRLDGKEKRSAQKGVLAWSGLMFVVGFVVAGLDFRFGWSCVPGIVVGIAGALFLIAYGLYGEVMRENAYLSRTIQVEEGQKVVDTGLYSVVRHPMYMVTVVLFLSIPVVLGSWYALICFCIYPVLIVIRLKDEEALLAKELPGYEDYMKKVKYRLIPFMW